MPRKHGHDEHCRELHRALGQAKAALRSAPIRDTIAGDPHSAVAEFRLEREATLTADIARIEQALREHGCMSGNSSTPPETHVKPGSDRQPDVALGQIPS